jgi:hypothetical protein
MEKIWKSIKLIIPVNGTEIQGGYKLTTNLK